MTVDLIADSKSHLVSVAFPESTSRQYGLAITIAESSAKYEARTVRKRLLHLCVFDDSYEHVALLKALLDHLANCKGVQVFAKGHPIEFSKAKLVVGCYLKSFAVSDWRAHCYIMEEDMEAEREKLNPGIWESALDEPHLQIVSEPVAPDPEASFVFPCRHLAARFDFQPHHPSSLGDQIESQAVWCGVHWCPKFQKVAK